MGEGGGACELPPRAGPAAAKHLKLQQQLSFLQTSRATSAAAAPSTWVGTPTSASRPRVSSCNGPLTITTITSLTLSPPGRTRPKKEDLVAEERRPEREGELLPRAPLFHLRLSSVLGTATSLTNQLTDTSAPTLTSRQLQRLPNNP